MFRAIVGGLVGGVVGAAIWAVVALALKSQSVWVAIGVGAIVGWCAAKAAGLKASNATGMAAAAIALVAIFVGKFVAVSYIVDVKFTQRASNMTITDEMLKALLADEAVKDMDAAGTKLTWPPGLRGIPQKQQDYPPEAWAEAERRWTLLPTAERESLRADYHSQVQALSRDMTPDVRWEKFKKSFGFLDALAFLAALAAAWKFGSGA